METYFNKIPTVEYNGVVTRNITERVVMVTTPRLVPTNYYPYELTNHIRPDQLAGAYYGDPALDWMIFLVNNIVDPYYGWHLFEEDFDAFIIKKYGSIEYSQQLITFWRNNWYDNTEEVSVSHYNLLPSDHKKYFKAVFGVKGNIKGYLRRDDDWLRATNRIEKWAIIQGDNANSGGAISNGTLMKITQDTFDVGWAECIMTNSTIMYVKHIIGNNSPNNIVVAWANNSQTAFIQSVIVMQEFIPDTEAVFWEPVAHYDDEREKNENKRFIELLDAGYVMETSEAIRKVLLKKPTFQ